MRNRTVGLSIYFCITRTHTHTHQERHFSFKSMMTSEWIDEKIKAENFHKTFKNWIVRG